MQTTGKYVNGMTTIYRLNFKPLNNPESDTVEEMVHRVSRYFADNPQILGVELFTTDDEGNQAVVGYIRNPSMKSLFNDVHQSIKSYETLNKPRTVEIRPRP
jgi:hypothetical protein